MGSLKGIYHNNFHENGVIAIENSYFTTHEDLEATAMSTDWTGKWVLLAGRRDIALQNLQRESENEEILHKFHRNSKVSRAIKFLFFFLILNIRKISSTKFPLLNGQSVRTVRNIVQLPLVN